VALVALVGLALLSLAFLVRGRLGRRVPAEPVPGAADAVLARIASLRTGLGDEARARTAIEEAAQLVREEIARRFGLPALRRSSEETCSQLARREATDTDALDALVRLLARADALKYGRGLATHGFAESALRDAETFLGVAAGGRP
jgi:hypothetical protein